MNSSPSSPILSYDGSFPGFLCAAAEALNAERAGHPFPPIRRRDESPSLFDETILVYRDDARAGRFLERLGRKADAEALSICFEAFCSDLTGVEDALARVLSRMFREGGLVLGDFSTPESLRVLEASRRSQCQAQKLMGLVRFSELDDGSWYAAVEPDCDLLPLLGEHFSARYAAMAFVLHDRRRGKALLHRVAGPWTILEGFGLDGSGELPLSLREKEIREGWRLYFRSVAITERRNPRLQMSHMPKKYWPLLPEMDAQLSLN